MTELNAIVQEPTEKATSCVIWLHGLGASGDDFADIVPHLNLPEDHGIRFIFPHANSIPVTINGGMRMPAWYDILEILPKRTINNSQFSQSVQDIRELIQTQINDGIPSEQITLIGFSQGGAIAYEAALLSNSPLAGLVCLSTYLARPLEPSLVNQSLPILVCHGQYDGVVPLQLGEDAITSLNELGLKPTYHQYPMQHEVCLEEIQHISNFIQSVLL